MSRATAPDIARNGPNPERDRLATTLFMAAVLHGMLIAGISFSGDGGPVKAPGLEVAPTEPSGRDEPREQPAAYIGKTAQRGTGTTAERVTAQTPAGATPGEGGTEASGAGSDAKAASAAGDAVVASSAMRLRVRLVAAPQVATDARASGDALALPYAGEPLTVAAQLSGPVLPVADLSRADTEASVIAPYLEAWRSKVERLGTLNYPAIARRLETRISPVLDVELAANGRLVGVTVQRSSGFADVDQAALEILKLASPFDPFPRDLARRYPTLRFAYEWRFDRGSAVAGAAAAPGAAAAGDDGTPAAYSVP
jgi:protein TonB